MLQTILTLGAVTLLVIAAFGGLVVLGFRRKWPLMLGAVIWASKRWINPRQMRTAGQPGSVTGVIRHVGRRSGRHYETPVGPFATDDGFVIVLPYGRRPDWLRNVLAAGSAEIVYEGRTVDVGAPEVLTTAEVMPYLPAGELRNLRLMGTDECLRVRTTRAAP